LPSLDIEHHGASVADAPTSRKGDYLIGDSAIHATTAPTEALIRKCSTNLDVGLRPIIVTTLNGASGATALATDVGINGRIDILEIEQFLATNIYELSGFKQTDRSTTIQELVEKYNSIIESCETDPSLKIEIA